jgi:hypothetical protein
LTITTATHRSTPPCRGMSRLSRQQPRGGVDGAARRSAYDATSALRCRPSQGVSSPRQHGGHSQGRARCAS